MKLTSSWDICVFTELLLFEGSLANVKYVGVTLEIEEGGEGGSNKIWEWRGWKGGWKGVACVEFQES